MNKKNVIILIVVIILAIVAYRYFSGNNADEEASLISENRTAQTGDAKYILNLLNQMSGVKLENGIFFRQSFQNLVDTSVALIPQSVGRINPFAPINPSEVSRTSTTTAR